MKALLFIFLSAVGLMIGARIATYVFFGIITLIGFIALVESIPMLKFFVIKTTGLIDIILFVLTIAATAKLGVTVSAGLSIAGLGYSLVYAPYLRNKYFKRKDNRGLYR